DNDFEPEYETLDGKKDVIDKIKSAAKDVDMVYLSPDPDREGEAIAWHISEILPKGVPYKRVTFNSITKEAVQEALKHPRNIDPHLVDAQQARRLLDRMVGYKLSPILQRKIGKGGKDGSLSAGRVQSVALKLVVLREKEIEAFNPVEYWNLGSFLQKEGKKTFEAHLYSVDDKRVEKEAVAGKDFFLIQNEKIAKEIEKELKAGSYIVEKVEKKEKKRSPPPPFITSTLQQEAARHYGFSASRTMNIAQGLYEGIELGTDGPEGLITYMRTDSVRSAPEALETVRSYISKNFDKEYLPQNAIPYSSKKNVQDAHEAIRPTNPFYTPDKIRSYLTLDEYKLYSLIWKRFVASQMNPAVYDTVSANIRASKRLVLRASGSVVKFAGYLALYQEKEDEDDVKEEDELTLPPLQEGDALKLEKTFATQSFTKAPPRYTEASLVKELEKSGIGRPSTYASIMQKIVGRAYTTKEKGALKPTELGKIIVQMLDENFDNIMNIGFTAEMENELDRIADTGANWKEFLKNFWKDFFPKVEKAAKEAHVPKVTTEIICPECGGHLQKIWSRNKYFYGCEHYPECKYTAPLEEATVNKDEYAADFDWEQPCPKCGSEMKPRKSRFGFFLGCTNYPECKGIVNIPRKGDPIAKDLPPCPAIGCGGQIVARKSRFGKTFFSCSNYPDCDVIGNQIEELEEKYKGHPKTPYEKKGKPAKAKSTKAAPEKKSGAKASGEKKSAAKSAKKEKAPARKQAGHKLSKELALIVGSDEMSRPEVTKALWDYIKKHNLQDPNNKRLINPDKALATVFGSTKPVDMMKLAGIISKHIV
ncbi:MAG: type I DNA topoisomerase, partial [Chlamydiae bacterium]|nr:type I DNA topoisomerase [Chlamydiota bacterium]